MTRKKSGRPKRAKEEATQEPAELPTASPELAPDPNAIDTIGDELGVPRAPDEEVRTSQEILEGRDRYRWEQEQ